MPSLQYKNYITHLKNKQLMPSLIFESEKVGRFRQISGRFFIKYTANWTKMEKTVFFLIAIKWWQLQNYWLNFKKSWIKTKHLQAIKSGRLGQRNISSDYLNTKDCWTVYRSPNWNLSNRGLKLFETPDQNGPYP